MVAYLLIRIGVAKQESARGHLRGADTRQSVWGGDVFMSSCRERGLNCISGSEDEGVSWMEAVKEDFILPWVGKQSK